MTRGKKAAGRRKLVRVEASIAAMIIGMNVAVAQERPSGKPKTETATDDALPVAAEAATTSSGVVQDVVVTAQRREQDIQEVPIAITAVPGQRIENLHFRDAADISLLVPNFNAQPSGRLTPRWFLRGVGIADPRAISPLGIHYDDVYLQNTTFTNFPLFDLERVEVLRGPQGTLWGKNTTAGAINFISRKPTFEPQENYFQADFGNYSSKLFNGGVGGTIIPDRVAARFAFHVDTSDGYTFNQIDGSRVGDITVGALRGAVLVKVTDDLDALFNVHYNKFFAPHATAATHFISTRPDGTNGFGYRFPPPSLYNYYASLGNAFTDLQTYGGYINLTQKFGDYTLVSISALDHLDNSTQGSTGIPQLAPQTRGFVSDQQISQEFRLLSPGDGPFTWLAGAHLFYDDLSTVDANATLPGGPQFSRYQNITNRTTTSEYAGFAHVGYQLDPVFKIEAGIRYTYESRSNQLLALTGGSAARPARFSDPWQFWLPASVSTPLGYSAYQDASRNWPALTYDITPEITISDNVRAYFRYAKGFRSGAFNVSATSQGQVAVVNPEVLYDYEGGIKSEWFDNRLIFNMAAFYYDYQNIQINVLAPTGPGGSAQSTISNGGTGYSKGLEFETRALPTDDFEFIGNLGLLWTGFTNTPPGSGISVGNDFVRAPHVSLGWGGRYTFPLAEYSLPGAIVLSTDWKFTTKFYYGVSDAAHNPTQIQSPTLIGNGQLVYKYENYELGLWARNITNRRFPVVMLPTAYGASGSEEVPRSFGGTFRLTF